MTPRLIVALCVRLAALMWLLYTLGHMYGLFMYLNTGSVPPVNKTMVWFFAILQVACCGVLWFFPSTIAAKLLPSAARVDELPSPPLLVEWQTLGVILVGLWGLSRAVPDTIFWLSFYALNTRANFGGSSLDPREQANMITTAAELAISFWLIFGAKGFAAFLFKIRTAGVAK